MWCNCSGSVFSPGDCPNFMSIDLSCNFKINFKIKLFVSFMPVLHDSTGQWEVLARADLKQTSQLSHHQVGKTKTRTIMINLEMINETSSLSFIWRIIRIIIRRCECWNRPAQNSITESLKPCKVWLRVYLRHAARTDDHKNYSQIVSR